MNCLRCGRETQDEKVFCESCLEEMEKYPVRPGTAVMLPRRGKETAPKKTRRHQTLSLEDQLRKLRKQRRILTAVLCLSLLLLAGSVIFCVRLSRKPSHRPGQNYSSVETTQAQIP